MVLSSYVIDINKNTTTLAEYDEKRKRFWCYQRVEGLPKLKLGQDMDKYSDGINEVNKEIVKAIKEYKVRKLMLKEKYKNYNPLKMHELTLFNILDIHFQEKYTIDTFNNTLADIVYLICKAMGIDTILTLSTEERIKYGIEYPEDIIEIVDAIENILTNHEINFYFYDFEDGKRKETKEYKEFKWEIEKRTHLDMTKIKTQNEVGETILRLRGARDTYEYREISKCSPRIRANSTTLVYSPNILDKEAKKHKITNHSESNDNQRWTLCKLANKRKKYKLD